MLANFLDFYYFLQNLPSSKMGGFDIPLPQVLKPNVKSQ